MLYTRKGDDGTTKTFGCDQKRISKSSSVAEALGAMDEANSFLGLCKVRAGEAGFSVRIGARTRLFSDIVHELQQNLFIVQAELAGAPGKTIKKIKITQLEKIIDTIERELPPIKTFFISGGSEIAALFDVARTLARRAERRVTAAADEGAVTIGTHTRAYLNRLSSVLYALARLSNHRAGIAEEAPAYK
jgi:cob(I)alamin adenosyltransferase